MFGIGSTELLVILVVALVVLGPKSLPGIAKTIGKVMGEFRRVSNDLQRTMNAEIAQEEHEERKKQAEKELFGSNDSKDIPKDYAPHADKAKKESAQSDDQDIQSHTQEEKAPQTAVEKAVVKAKEEAQGQNVENAQNTQKNPEKIEG